MVSSRKIAAAAGFTLVELLVVVAIISMLVALLMPAVQQAREAARVAQCQSHLRQIALAALLHLDAQGHFPTGGWGYAWTGDPDRGFGKRQPGGWVYSILPYLEQQALHDLGTGLPDAQKRAAAAQRMEVPLAEFNCPSRRPPRTYPVNSFRYRTYLANADVPQLITRSDYAINVGTVGDNTIEGGGPESLRQSDATYPWEYMELDQYNGLSYPRSEIEGRKVSDGFGSTILVGEKYLNPDFYDTGKDPSDGGHMYSGFAPDTFRMAGRHITFQRDAAGNSNDKAFGSTHLLFCHFAMCGGAVRRIGYGIDRSVLERLANRSDGESADVGSASDVP